MLVRNSMTTSVDVVGPEDQASAVAARLHARRVRQFPVVRDGRLVGIVTDRDLRGADPNASIAAIMTPDPMVTGPECPVEEAAATLRARKVGALPVVDRGRLVGIISESDLLEALVDLCDVLEPTTVLKIECDEGAEPRRRLRHLLERHGDRVLWLTAVADGRGRQRVDLRLRTSVGHCPEHELEEAGFRVLSSITGGAAAGRAALASS